MILFVKCYVVLHLLMFFGKEWPTMLVICSFCGYLIEFVCLSVWCCGGGGGGREGGGGLMCI